MRRTEMQRSRGIVKERSHAPFVLLPSTLPSRTPPNLYPRFAGLCLVLGWGTAWEDLRVLSASFKFLEFEPLFHDSRQGFA